MNNHKNARLTVHGRLLLVRRILEHGLRAIEAAQAAGVSARTAYKRLHRYNAEGEERYLPSPPVSLRYTPNGQQAFEPSQNRLEISMNQGKFNPMLASTITHRLDGFARP